MSDRNNNPGVSPLGKGHKPQTDPFKGLKGMMAGIMIMEALAVMLILPVIGKMWDGKYATAFNLGYIGILAVLMTVAAFLQFRPWADGMNIVLQVLLVIGGVVVHPVVFIVAVLFIAAWWYTYYLRGRLKKRMDLGLLPAQHYTEPDNSDSGL
ncbi:MULTISPECIES: DUF4233 domain-containing protein [Corynebacterium]|jgi:membrane protease YdiL (CAAX protease family)|uniref:DUF4233 domain-containing protein n=1 Tax=Corynebacterium provencense TaxID=1737425 RepID=A0A2Z3YVS7_9CORY|nr:MULTISPECIES: DUF4233 domain-containing protein [Corynebacterium]AWT26664.1 hypothetical protein Csp1_18910 [Corynebacterium provencense]MCI1256737.1 DUF4233 domain-containing protein [Corynebacterium provencense]